VPWCSDVTDEDLRRYLPDALSGVGAIASYARLEGGTYNTGVQVRLQDGQDVVAKISPPSSAPGLAYEAGLLPTEADYFRRTLPLGVPVPEVLVAGREAFPGRHHLVMSKVPGRPWWGLLPAPSGAQRAVLRRQLGRLVALAHQAPCDGFGYMFGREHLRGDTWPEAFGRMMGALLHDAARFGTDLPLPADEIGELVDAHRSALAEVERPALVHFDLWDGNILVSGEGAGPVVTGIIDAERALHGDPLFEFPSLAVLSDRAKDPSFAVDDDFLQGYCEVTGPLVFTGAALVRLALYRSYLYLVMLIEVTPRQISGEHEHWRRTEVRAIIGDQLNYLEAQLP
jgi:aminoglycoside phosphotransferase (APT) family kinase protein